MMAAITHISAAAIGAGLAWALARHRIRECKAEALRLLLAQQVDLTTEDFARQVGA